MAERRTSLDSVDPLLSTMGAEQAESLAERLGELRGDQTVLVSSPMRRALSTAAPTAHALGCDVVVHGALYEFACCGRDRPGRTTAEVRASWAALGSDRALPDCRCDGFVNDRWDYRGCSATRLETEPEARERGARLVEWLQATVHAPGAATAVVVVAHQTLLDLVMQLLLEPQRCGADWQYGRPRHRFGHTAVAEVRPGETPADAWRLVHAPDSAHHCAPAPPARAQTRSPPGLEAQAGVGHSRPPARSSSKCASM